MPLSVTRVVNTLQCSDELYCPLHQSGVAVAGATNAVNTKQSEAVTVSLFFSAPSPHAFNPITPTHRHFVLSPVSLTSRDQNGGPSDLRSHGNIEDCEQSTSLGETMLGGHRMDQKRASFVGGQ